MLPNVADNFCAMLVNCPTWLLCRETVEVDKVKLAPSSPIRMSECPRKAWRWRLPNSGRSLRHLTLWGRSCNALVCQTGLISPPTERKRHANFPRLCSERRRATKSWKIRWDRHGFRVATRCQGLEQNGQMQPRPHLSQWPCPSGCRCRCRSSCHGQTGLGLEDPERKIFCYQKYEEKSTTKLKVDLYHSVRWNIQRTWFSAK